MAIDYARLAALSESLVEANGRSVTVYRKSTTPANASKPWRGTSVEASTITVLAVLVPYDAKDVDGDLIRREDQMAIIAATSDTVDGQPLEDFDELLDGTDRYKIQNVRLYKPGSQRLAYVMQLRR